MQRTEFKLDKRIAIYGSKLDRAIAEKLLRELGDTSNRVPTSLSEGEARLKIQDLIDTYNLKAHILFDGNRVWGRRTLLRNLRSIINSNHMNKMSKELYKFLHLVCGSIAHYDRYGWIATYPTVNALRNFFVKNEYGKRVLDHLPVWYTDAKRIVKEMERLLKIE
ncbi:MAG: hypothetical protein ACE5NN_03265 [Candidatus Bathyarchaeia archaeon]